MSISVIIKTIIFIVLIDFKGGEWITAYQAEQKRHLRTVMVSSKLEGTRSKVIAPPTNTREASSSQKCILNTRFLLENCYVNTPNDLSVANISGKELIDVSSDHAAVIPVIIWCLLL